LTLQRSIQTNNKQTNMPFIADSRCGVWNIELNVGEICGELERMLEKEYSEDIKEGSKFWLYVIQIENALNRCDTMPDFWEWFLTDGEYNNVETWNEIQDLFVNVEEEEEEEDSVAHPVYKCDGGCGTIMGSDDDCKRICDDCEDEEEEKCEKCGTTENICDYWWVEQKNEKWKLCDNCGDNEEQEKTSDDKKKEEEDEDMNTISWVSQNSKYIDVTIDRSNKPDTEPESDTDYDTEDLPTDSEDEEEKECASCNNILTWEDGEYSGEGHRCSGCYFKEEGEN